MTSSRASEFEMGRDYSWLEREQFCEGTHLDVMRWSNLPKPAYLLEETLVLRQGLCHVEEGYWALGENGHHHTSCGNREHWHQRIPGEQGRLNVAKFKHKAQLVRALLPPKRMSVVFFGPSTCRRRTDG